MTDSLQTIVPNLSERLDAANSAALHIIRVLESLNGAATLCIDGEDDFSLVEQQLKDLGGAIDDARASLTSEIQQAHRIAAIDVETHWNGIVGGSAHLVAVLYGDHLQGLAVNTRMLSGCKNDWETDEEVCRAIFDGAAGASDVVWLKRAVLMEHVKARHSISAADPRRDVDDACILFHGKGSFSIGDREPIRVTDRESAVLESFLGVAALDLAEMKQRSGYDKAREVLSELRKSYRGRFGPAITLPGGKGQGGYRVKIREAD